MQRGQVARNAARWTVALALGLCQSEALGLRWSDVDLAEHPASGAACTASAASGLVFEEPKAERDHAEEFWEGHELVFAPPNGRPLDKKATTTTGSSCSSARRCSGCACTTAGTPPPHCS